MLDPAAGQLRKSANAPHDSARVRTLQQQQYYYSIQLALAAKLAMVCTTMMLGAAGVADRPGRGEAREAERAMQCRGFVEESPRVTF